MGKAQKTTSIFLDVRNCLLNRFQEVQLTSETLKSRHILYQLHRQDPTEKCEPQLQLAFAKTHKTGSSTLQNIIFRWDKDKHEMTQQEKSLKKNLNQRFCPLYPSKPARVFFYPGMENGTIWHLPCQRQPTSSPTGSFFTLQ